MTKENRAISSSSSTSWEAWKIVVLLIICAVSMQALVQSACAAKAPPSLSPEATTAWYGTRVIKALDLLRDSATSAEAAHPQLLSTETTRRIVLYHRAALQTIHDAPAGWPTT